MELFILFQVLSIPIHMVKLGEQSKQWKKYLINKVFDYNKDATTWHHN